MPESSPAPLPPTGLPPVAHLRTKATALLLLTAALILGSALYLMYARGMFEATQPLVLLADDSEGVSVGMDMTFSGFPIGRVRRIELAPSGDVRILVDVVQSEARWLRSSSVFTLVRGVVGPATIKAYSGVRDDPPLPAGAERPVLRGDASAQIPELMLTAHALLRNLRDLSAADAPLPQTLANAQQLSTRLQGPQGALGVLLGNTEDVRQVSQLLARSQQLAARLESIASQTERQVLAPEGLLPQVQASVTQVSAQINGLLQDTRHSLQKLDAVLAQAETVSTNAATASTDLVTLRAEVESNLRQMEALMQTLQRQWPFARQAREPELALP